MDTAIADLPKSTRAGKPRKVNHALAGALLAAGMSYDQVAPRVGAATGNSLRVGLAKQGVSATSMRNPEVMQARKVTVVAQVASEAAEIVKDRIQGRLAGQIEQLSKRKVGKLASKGQGEAAVLKTLAETWRTLNGNPDSVTVQFGANLLSSFNPESPQPAIDCPHVAQVLHETEPPQQNP